MQYGVHVPTYNRVGERKKKKILESNPIRIITIMIAGLMLGRVGFGFVEGLYIAPFGVGYLISSTRKNNEVRTLLAFLSVIIGYITQYNVNKEVVAYIAVAVVVLLIQILSKLIKKELGIGINFFIATLVFVVIGVVLGEQGIITNIFFALIKSLVIIPVFYILNYGVSCISQINTNYFYSTEELISIAILTCLVVSGIGNVSILGIDIRNLSALAIIVTVAYAAGSSAGAILGVSMGLIIGISKGDILIATSLYSICGLVVGIFKDTGKILASIAYIIVSLMVLTYINEYNITMVIEVVLSVLIMLIIPIKFMKNILNEINNDEKNKIVHEAQIEGVKSEFIDRLECLRGSLTSVAESIENLSGNEKLLLKNKGAALVENLADRVCQGCEMNNKCWGRELHNTFSEFSELMLSCEAKNAYLPKELNKKCVKRSTLLTSAQDLIATYTINEALRSRLIEGRKIIAGQVNSISLSVSDILTDFNKNVNSCLEIDDVLRKTLSKNRVRYKNIYSFTDRKERLKIKITLEKIDDETYCSKIILPIISDFIKIPLNIVENSITINPKTGECSVIIEESPKYHACSYVAFNVKDGEQYSGDSYSFGANKIGEYVTMISDGMGSGPEAGLESEAAIDLVESFMEGGFSEETILNTVNAIMGMKFSENEKFTTLDMNSIDLYTGEITFIKVGGSISFIKRGENVDIINIPTLPLGILDEIKINPVKKKIKQGDMVITLSDGIVDINRSDIGNYSWITDYLKNCSSNPEIVSREILENAKKISNGKILDDMTVIVSKLYSAY